ncbi:hypothetical protein LOK49_LG13G02100 [Camellia lanceoleosa]|uniref:Uncharacterized protein n=1 Tax=Camellia lanceoleosa TaxID=1840588 RepID=A0ACC0FLR9_9ERIC|nr:hypothetical protein LOK49_LG13G02100 [Camellia lanceoleosa]
MYQTLHMLSDWVYLCFLSLNHPLLRRWIELDEEVLDEVYASNGSKPAPDYSRPKRSKRSKRKHAAEKMTKDRNGQESEVENEEWSAKSQGRYSSRVALPENVEFEKIKAEVKDGVLYITIPKASGTSKVLDINVQ